MGERVSGQVDGSTATLRPPGFEATGFGGVEVSKGMVGGIPRRHVRPDLVQPGIREDLDPNALFLTMQSLRSIARRDAPTPANLVDWTKCLMRADVLPLCHTPGRMSHQFERALRDDLGHMLRKGNGSGAFCVVNEEGAIRFALDVVRAVVLSSQPAGTSTSPRASASEGVVPDSLLESHLVFLMRAWRHVGSWVRD